MKIYPSDSKSDSDLPTIDSLFTPESVSPDGGITLFSDDTSNRKSLYIVNEFGIKLLKLALKNEQSQQNTTLHAQIKLIGYGIKRAKLWKDEAGDPETVCLFGDVEMTYHGSAKEQSKAKVHVKASTGYRTLIDGSLELPDNTQAPVPLFSLQSGYKNYQSTGDKVTRSGHVLSTGHRDPVRLDFYLAGANFDRERFFKSFYFFTMLTTLDYLSTSKMNPFSSGLIIAPISVLSMGRYALLVRRSVSDHHGRPCLHFFVNQDYYRKLMGRRIAYKEDDGSVRWSTMADEEGGL